MQKIVPIAVLSFLLLSSDIKYQTHGQCFSPYLPGQQPGTSTIISKEQIKSRMELIQPYTKWIRTYGVTGGLEESGAVAHKLGLKVFAQAWLDSDPVTNNAEIANLIARANAGEMDVAVVGGEVLLREDLTESELIDFINQVKAAIPSSIPVTYNDTHEQYLEHPNIVNVVDFILVNYYPFWEGVNVEGALSSLNCMNYSVATAYPDKKIIVGETGWPSEGNAIGDAIPSTENAARFFKEFVSWARANSFEYFYFESFDEEWKESVEGSIGAHWGIWDKIGMMKEGMESVFRGETTEDTWTYTGGVGTPDIEFVTVPSVGSEDELTGIALHVNPCTHRVAVYIKVGDGWWTKPNFNNPLTTISYDGAWGTDIVTGGLDSQATMIAAYLIPSSYEPPLLDGEGVLPIELEENSLDSVVVDRNP